MHRRSSGILLHVTSLPGGTIGDLGPAAFDFLDWLSAAGQSVWQVLPLGPVTAFNSPYGTISAFAGNPLLVSIHGLAEEGLLAPTDLAGEPTSEGNRVDFSQASLWKERMLRRAWARFRARSHRTLEAGYASFLDAPEQDAWLDTWALFASLRERYEARPWHEWPAAVRDRRSEALDAARHELEEEVDYHRFVQFLFFRQWSALKRAANTRGVRLFGDLSIYVAADSADVWAQREFFDLDPGGRPRVVAGVPPDAFSATGQRWGNPLYRWDRLREDGYSWWTARLRANLRLVDLLRIDHFRGFAGYWEVPGDAVTAEDGQWRQGPGRELFEAASAVLGDLPLIAEDLGAITPDVDELRQALGIPCMRVLQFAFNDPESDHQPHRLATDTVIYTGTHDNDTSRGWLEAVGPEIRRRALSYLGTDGSEIEWDLIEAALDSQAKLAIVPIQDVLGLGSEARMNTPGTADGNWEWRLETGQLDGGSAARLRDLATRTGRT